MELQWLRGFGGVLAVLALGCATSGPNPAEELRQKRARSHFDLAVDHVENGRVEIALRELIRADELDPGNPRIQHGLAIAYLQKGRMAEAEQHLKTTLALRPGYQDARINLSTLYLSQGRFDESIEHSKILADDATFHSPWRALANWGWAEYARGNRVEGQELLESARERNPRYWPTLMNLGILASEGGRKLEAIRYLTDVLSLEPGASATAEASYRLAEIYVSLGMREKAVGHLRSAVMKAPGDPWGKKSEEYLRLLR